MKLIEKDINGVLIAGVRSMDVSRKEQNATVTGYMEANKVLKKVKAMGKRAEIWPYVPYSLVGPSLSDLIDLIFLILQE